MLDFLRFSLFFTPNPLLMKTAKLLLLLLLGILIAIPVVLLNTPFSSLFLSGFAMTMALLTGLWVISLIIKDTSIIDIYWGLGFVFIAWFYAYKVGFENLASTHYILLGLVTLWGTRLGGYLAWRNLGKGEDYRYVLMRKEGGKHWWWISFLRVFLLQGILLWGVSAVFVPALLAKGGLSIFIYLGIVLWAIGFFFEVVGDYQLARFKKNRSSQEEILNTGLWRYTRHPNYFGDATMWWGYFCFALAHPAGWAYVLCPMIMTFLLMKISGVAMLERGLKKTKPKYEEYVRRTSAFIPMPPKA